MNTSVHILPVVDPAPTTMDSPSDRRVDLQTKQTIVGALLQQAGCDGLLVLDPENFAWLTSGAVPRGVLDPAEQPALLYTVEQRWLLVANTDSQRMFDEELEGMGFLLKEWPWYWRRGQMLADLGRERKLACDRAVPETKFVGEQLRRLRRVLSPYEQACLRVLGATVAHALEATCRTLRQGETEREIAGQLSHRLYHRGAIPIMVGVAVDERARAYRRPGFTAMPVKDYAVLHAAARKYGLTVQASRSVHFGTAPLELRREHDAACKVAATYLASTWPDGVVGNILAAGRRIYELTRYEHEWRQHPQGHVTGRAAVELALLPKMEDLLQAGWALTWSVGVGGAMSCDTFLVADQGPRATTPSESWPLKAIRVQGAEFVRPDILTR